MPHIEELRDALNNEPRISSQRNNMNKTKCASCGIKLTNENKQENKWDDEFAPICKKCFSIYSNIIKDVQVVSKKDKYPLWIAQYQ